MEPYLNQGWRPLLEQNGLRSFDDFWAMEKTWVEKPNKRRGGSSGVARLELSGPGGCVVPVFLKCQENQYFRSVENGFRARLTYEREIENLLKLATLGVPVVEPLYFEEKCQFGKSRAVLLTPELSGYRSLQDWLILWDREGWPGKSCRQKIAERLGAELGRFHRLGWCYRALYPKHVFLRISEGELSVRFIDLENARTSWWRRRDRIKDLGPFFRRTRAASPRDRLCFLRAYTTGPGERREFMKAVAGEELQQVRRSFESSGKVSPLPG
ncbi:MAG: lipopolysaccharide kinase InaA family protein [Verrucomicrobiota bacterium]